ncbi:CYTH domain-containing protein [Draconibacterium sp.]|nr:CYTH domain-containing protein [Draconibacterium sp.]
MQEIERKFLVDKIMWQPTGKGIQIKQAYLSVDYERVVRIRISGERSFLTIKGKATGLTRAEFEYEIPLLEAEQLMQICLYKPIVKTRYVEYKKNIVWEIDVFEDENEGLVLAEVELDNEKQKIKLPQWIQKEVSEDYRYYNSWLSQNPYSDW